jgi:hypothetical protein
LLQFPKTAHCFAAALRTKNGGEAMPPVFVPLSFGSLAKLGEAMARLARQTDDPSQTEPPTPDSSRPDLLANQHGFFEGVQP